MHKYKHTHDRPAELHHTHKRWGFVVSSRPVFVCTHTDTHTLCGLVAATADAVHEYFSQTLWQSFHLHGPDVSSWNIYHSGPWRSRPKLCVCTCNLHNCVCFFVFMLNLGGVIVCVFIHQSDGVFLFFSALSDRDCQAVERDMCSAHPLPVAGGGTCTPLSHAHAFTYTHSVFRSVSMWQESTQKKRPCLHLSVSLSHTELQMDSTKSCALSLKLKSILFKRMFIKCFTLH